MAHFAQLDKNNKVVNVVVVADEDTADENGIESEAVGVAFLKSALGNDVPDGTYWKQTSYNTIDGEHPNNQAMRLNYAGVGMIYDPDRDVFRRSNGPTGWVLNDLGRFVPPIPAPDDGDYYWDEDTESWEPIVHPEGYEPIS